MYLHGRAQCVKALRGVQLLRADEVDNHADDAGAAGAAAQVHGRVLDLILQQLVQLPAQLLHQLSHLGHRKGSRVSRKNKKHISVLHLI